MSEKILKNLRGTRGGVAVLVFGTLDKPRELKFQLWLRLSEKYLKILRRTRGSGGVTDSH